MGIHFKLSSVQNRLKAPKGQFNSFGKYKYRSCEDILEALKPLLNDNSLYVMIDDEVLLIGDRYYIKATVTLIDAETGEHLSSSAFAREEESKKGMDASQITGATSSYARKYALNGMFAIDDTKDADATNEHGAAKEDRESPKSKASVKSEKWQELYRKIAETGSNLEPELKKSLVQKKGKAIGEFNEVELKGLLDELEWIAEGKE